MKRLAKLGVVRANETDGTFRPIDVQRIRVAEAFVDSGLAVEDLGRLVAEGHVTFPNLEAVFGEPIAASDTTFADFASWFGRDPDLLRRVYAQLGLPRPHDDDRLRADDLEFLREFLVVFDARDVGLGDDFLLRAARLCGDSIRHLVESVNAMMRDELGPALARSSTGEPELRGGGPFAATSRLADWLLRRHLEAVIHANIVENIERVMEETGIGRRRDPHPPAIGFLDLSGFTGLTGAKGDEEAARLAVQLSDLVQETTASRSGRAVKSLGDGVMLHFREPGEAVSAALDLVDAIARAGLPAARVGIAAGPVVFRDGDYFGRAVNMASRITDYARPSEVLVNETVAESAAAPGTAFEDLGVVELKGIREPARLFRATRDTRVS
ncbi:MAG TPA: adenylate/guanylate cyclase domain-containing protein [Gaiellaceae bacterium]|nr:adenylate/guanylate cyclase domain-containing protein [Gaiellaceae bacterium]